MSTKGLNVQKRKQEVKKVVSCTKNRGENLSSVLSPLIQILAGHTGILHTILDLITTHAPISAQ